MKIYFEPEPVQEESDLNPQKEHETDLTGEEKRRRKRERFRNMSPSEKLGYFWDYYKWVLLVLVVVIVVIHEGIGIYRRSKLVTLLSFAVLDANYGSEIGQKQLEEDLLQKLGTGDPYEVIAIDNGLMSGDEQAAVIKRAVTIAAGMTDLVIVNDAIYQDYDEQEAFIPWDKVLGDRIEACAGLLDEEGRLDLSRSERWQSYELTGYEPVYAGALASSDRTEAAAAFAELMAE